MVKKKLSVIKNNTVKVLLKDLLKFKNYTTGCIEKNGKILSYGFLQDLKYLSLPTNIVDLLVADEKILFFGNDGRVYIDGKNGLEPYTLEKFNNKL